MTNGNDKPPVSQGDDRSGVARAFLNPIVILAVGMLIAIVLLIGATVLGLDKGLVLTKMGQVEFARGLITYLFAVVTIGTAVVLVVSALTAEETPAHEKRFERGKEILSLLLGVFGTIVGFYFGSEVAAKGQTAEETIVRVVPLRLTAGPALPNLDTVNSGAEFTVNTFVAGGKPPYRYGVGLDKNDIKAETPVDLSGWIVKSIAAPKVTAERTLQVRLVIEDADGHSTENSVLVLVKAGS